MSGPLRHEHHADAFPLNDDCDLLNRHYAPMPYDEVEPTTRVLSARRMPFRGLHEATEVTTNPGLRELWSHGSSDPGSDWGKYCAKAFAERVLRPAFLRALGAISITPSG